MSVADEIVVGYGSLQAGQEAFYKDLSAHLAYGAGTGAACRLLAAH
jgi:hypothetical protein